MSEVWSAVAGEKPMRDGGKPQHDAVARPFRRHCGRRLEHNGSDHAGYERRTSHSQIPKCVERYHRDKIVVNQDMTLSRIAVGRGHRGGDYSCPDCAPFTLTAAFGTLPNGHLECCPRRIGRSTGEACCSAATVGPRIRPCQDPRSCAVSISASISPV